MSMWIELVVLVLALAFGVYKLLHRSAKGGQKKDGSKQIPGVEPSDPVTGNKADIKKVGTLVTYLKALHNKYGPIVRFYEGTNMAISITSPEMLKQIRHLFDIPYEFFLNFIILTGPEGFSVVGRDETKRRRKIYDQHFMVQACRAHAKCFGEIAQEQIEKWKSNIKTPFALNKTMPMLSLLSLLRTSFGDCFKDEKAFYDYQHLVDTLFLDIDPFQPLAEDSEEYRRTAERCEKIRAVSQKIMDERRKERPDDYEQSFFLDVMLDMNITEEARRADLTGFITAGYFTLGATMTWFMYEVARSPEVQEKIYNEVVTQLGDAPLTFENISKLTYLRQTIDETLRLHTQEGFLLRMAETDLEIGGYFVPEGTSIYQLLGPIFMDSSIWGKDPEKFNPDRFSHVNSQGRHPYAFKPFGFAGKRQCAGQNYAYTVMLIFFSEWIRKFHFELVPGQEVKMIPGVISGPMNDIMATMKLRS